MKKIIISPDCELELDECSYLIYSILKCVESSDECNAMMDNTYIENIIEDVMDFYLKEETTIGVEISTPVLDPKRITFLFNK